jgi:hypothetical protein
VRLTAVNRKIDALGTEQARLFAELQRRSEPPGFDAMATMVAERVSDIRLAFDGATGEVGTALGTPLRGKRLSVYPEETRRLRVEGLLQVPINQDARSREGFGRLDCVVAGAGFEPTTSGL